MSNPALLKNIRKIYLNIASSRCNHPLSKQQLLTRYETGFTLIEMIVVVIIIAILSAIAAPGWLAFTNRQRVSKVNDAIFSALQQAQTQAKLKKLKYSVSFRIDKTSNPKGVLQYAVYQQASPIPTNLSWQPLGQNLEINPGQVALGTNLTTENNAAGSALKSDSFVSTSTSPTIIFDYIGNLAPQPSTNQAPNLGSKAKGIVIAATVSESNDSTSSFSGTKRCVVVKTLLGSMQIGQDTQCDPPY